MKSLTTILFFLYFSQLTFISFAQMMGSKNYQDEYRAVNWRTDDGLAHNKIYCMLKDVNGFLWIGTEGGLSRFDGSTFKNYFYDPRKPSTIAGPQIWGLVEDSLNNIWIGTDKGLSRYDIKADTLMNFFPGFTSLAHDNFIVPFSATKDEVYCREKDSLITSYDIHTLTKKNLIQLTPEDSLLSGNGYHRQSTIFDKSSNSVWMLSFKGNNVLLNISLDAKKRERYGWGGKHVGVESMRFDYRRNSIWLNTDGGLVEFSLSDKQTRRSDVLKELEKRSTGHIGIDLDQYGKVWFYTDPMGIFIYDPKSKSVRRVFETDSAIQKKICVANSTIYCDRDGMVWTGSWLREGIWQLTPFSEVVRNYNTSISNARGLSTNDIWYIRNGGESKMWMGTANGLTLYEPHKDTFVTHYERKLEGLTAKISTPIFMDNIHKKGWLTGEEFGPDLYEVDLAGLKCKPVIFRNDLNEEIFLDRIKPVRYKDGCIVSSIHNKQVRIFVVNSDSSVARQILSFPTGTINLNLSNPTPVTDSLLFLRRPDAMGNLTYAQQEDKWIRTYSPMDSISWSLIVYHRGDFSYWVVALRQLIHYDSQFHELKRYNIEDGLPHDEIYGLIPDNLGNIWFNTYRFIYHLNVETGQISTLTEKDGFYKADLRDLGEGIAKDDDGNLYFTTGGLYNGFLRVSPDKFVSPQALAYIKSLEIKDYFLPLSEGANSVQQLSLKYYQNRINIEAGSINFYGKKDTRIRYKLETNGKEENWQYSPANYTIRYEELPPGKYTFSMQAGNAGGDFNGPVKKLSINVSPAFWNTWWFRIPVVILLFGLVYFFVRNRVQQRFRLRLERSEKETQLAEIRQKASEMEMQALRAQMNPHFIFNSLNSINRFILQNDRLQASEYLTKFSKLVRLILHNSRASLISLESELESMQLYLDLEAVRFDHRFQYKISVPKDLDIEVLQVPPLIIQPFAENSIWHGLMHRPEQQAGKEEKGQLDIEVSQENDQLLLRIADNGIGRKAAAALASKTDAKHKSVGLKITVERIAMLQKSNGTESPVTINDLVHEDGRAAGTEVIIKMPLIFE